MSMQNSHLRRFLGTIFGSLAIAVTALPSLAAEQVIFSYGLIEVAISVDALATFAREGQLTDELAFYLQDTTSEERQELQAFLLTPVELGHVTVSQFLYSSLGEVLLQYLGDLVQTDSGLNGFHALRSAVVLAAADAEGLTILNVLQQFPTQTVRVNGPRVVQIAGATAQLLEQTEQMLALIEQQAALEIETATAVDFTQYRDLEQPGTLEWQVETLRAYDQTRDRTIEADLYQPQAASSERVPVVVISHGLGSDRRSFVDLAQHLASYGFGVVLLDHPGVNSQQIQKLFSGMANEVVDPREFIEAPKDVSFLLDELERLAQTSPQSVRLDLQQVGMMGHSFGGYIAFALAGAEFDLEGLQADCAADADGLNLVNFSLLLQCTLLELEEDAFLSLQDERITAVFTMNAIGSSIFGRDGLQQMNAPTMLVAGSHDAIAPAILEQVRPFAWLEGADKYLMVIQEGTHVYSALDVSIHEDLALPAELAGPDPMLARQYLKASSLAFMQTYVAEQSEYLPYLHAGYTQTISRQPLELMLVTTLMSVDSSLVE